MLAVGKLWKVDLELHVVRASVHIDTRDVAIFDAILASNEMQLATVCREAMKRCWTVQNSQRSGMARKYVLK